MWSRQLVIRYSICLFALNSLMIASIAQAEIVRFTGRIETVDLSIAFPVPDEWLMPEIVNRDGQFLQKEEAIRLIVEAPQNMYVPPNTSRYSWTVYENTGQYALLLTDANNETFWAIPDEPLAEITVDASEPPQEIESYTQMSRGDLLQVLQDLREMNFGTSEAPIRIITAREAGSLLPRYSYNPDDDSITDQETGTVYAGQEEGLYGHFVSDNHALAPGYTLFAHAIPFAEYVEMATSLEALQGEQEAVAHIGVTRMPEQVNPITALLLSSEPEIRIATIVDIFSSSYSFDDSSLTALDPSMASIDYTYDGGMSGLTQDCFILTKTIDDVYVVFANLCVFDDGDAEEYEDTFIQLLDSMVVSR